MATVIRQVLNGVVSIADGNSTVDATLSTAVLDQSKCFIVFGAVPPTQSPSNGNFTESFVDNSTIRFTRVGSTGAGAVSIEYYLVEASSGMTVQRGSTTFTASATINITISAVTLAKSWVLVNSREAGSTYDADDFGRGRLTSTTNLEVSFQSTSSTSFVSWQVIEYDDCTVQSGDIAFGTGSSSLTATLSPAITTSKSLLLFNYNSAAGTSANIGQKMMRGVITNTTTLTFDRGNTGQTINLTWFLIEFTDNTATQRGNRAVIASDVTIDITISSVDTAKSIALAAGRNSMSGRTGRSNDDNPSGATFKFNFSSATNLQLIRDISGMTNTLTADVYWQVITFEIVSTTYLNISIYDAINPLIESSTPTLIGALTGRSSVENIYEVGLSQLINALNGYSTGEGSENQSLSLLASLAGVSRGEGLSRSQVSYLMTLLGYSAPQNIFSYSSPVVSANLSGLSQGISTEQNSTKVFFQTFGYSVAGSSDTISISSGAILEMLGISRGNSWDNVIPSAIATITGQSQGNGDERNSFTVVQGLIGRSQGEALENNLFSAVVSVSSISRGSGEERSNVDVLLSLSGRSNGVAGEYPQTSLLFSVAGRDEGVGGDISSSKLEQLIAGISAGSSADFVSSAAGGILDLLGFSRGIGTEQTSSKSTQNLTGLDNAIASVLSSFPSADIKTVGISQGNSQEFSSFSVALILDLVARSQGEGRETSSINPIVSISASDSGTGGERTTPSLIQAIAGRSNGVAIELTSSAVNISTGGLSRGSSEDYSLVLNIKDLVGREFASGSTYAIADEIIRIINSPDFLAIVFNAAVDAHPILSEKIILPPVVKTSLTKPPALSASISKTYV